MPNYDIRCASCQVRTSDEVDPSEVAAMPLHPRFATVHRGDTEDTALDSPYAPRLCFLL